MAEPDHQQQFLVVGLGASAGGIQALSEFFAHVPVDEPIAYVVILHLSPEHESKLAQVLQTSTTLPVMQVRGPVTIEPKHVYVIPPTETLHAGHAQLTLEPMRTLDERKSTVDIFFRTLAEQYRGAAAAVVLSGTGANGSVGLKRVKEFGGLTMAQDPGDAEYPDMPQNAIATKHVDYVLPVADMPTRIVDYARRLRDGHGTDTSVWGPEDLEPLRETLRQLRMKTGQDFSNYKPATVKRRVERRMTIRGARTLADYAQLLRDSADEAPALMKELLISVTNFFRDPDAFAILEERVVPRLFEGKVPMDQLRVWSAGCATGEEAYSLGMLLLEYAATRPDPPTIQVFATDLDEQAIAIAREGLYPEADVAEVPRERLQRFFARETGGYRVRRELRELVLFAHHNVIKDPPFSHLDLIACRNLLIYLNRTVQERLIETFHFALRPGGVLFLGSSESPDGGVDLFVPINKAAHIYESRPVSTRLPLRIVDRPLPAAGPLLRAAEVRPADRVSAGELHLRLLEQFSPPSIVVTDEHTVVHMSERAGRYLQVPGGEPSRDLMKLVHQDLRGELRHALHLAGQNRQPVDVKGARMETPAGPMLVNMSVKPVLRDGTPPRGYFVLLFEEAGAAPAVETTLTLTSPSPGNTRHLDEELTRVREQLRVTIEQYETQAEEAKASNEELQAMNEELRSAAEELETSKEELQSVNEELTTVNQELKIKIEELGLTNNDFRNLINSSDLGAIFLDKSMRVKLATPRAQSIFNLLPTDVGRKLWDITSRLKYPDLHADVARVLDHLQTVDTEVETQDGHWYLMRIVPYRTLDDRIEGVALTFQDVTTRHEAERRLRESEERLRGDLETRVVRRTTALAAEVRSHEAAQQVRTLLRRVVTAQEDERARIARELHDQLGQHVTALRMILERHRPQCATDAAREDMDRALAAAHELDRAVDFLAWELRPAALDQLGLAAALPRFVDEWSTHYGLKGTFRSTTNVAGLLSPAAEIAFYRVAQEGLNNVGKHAHATRADVVIETHDDTVVMLVEDDGIGFDPADARTLNKGIGISGMRERADAVGATLEIESSPGKGTTVYLRCPVAARSAEGV